MAFKSKDSRSITNWRLSISFIFKAGWRPIVASSLHKMNFIFQVGQRFPPYWAVENVTERDSPNDEPRWSNQSQQSGDRWITINRNIDSRMKIRQRESESFHAQIVHRPIRRHSKLHRVWNVRWIEQWARKSEQGRQSEETIALPFQPTYFYSTAPPMMIAMEKNRDAIDRMSTDCSSIWVNAGAVPTWSTDSTMTTLTSCWSNGRQSIVFKSPEWKQSSKTGQNILSI